MDNMTNAEMASRLEFAAKCHEKQVEECLPDDSRTHDLLAQAMRAGASALRDSEWLPIEGAPQDRRYRLFWSPERLMAFQAVWNKEREGWQLIGGSMLTAEVTLYRPLPSPPKEQGNG